MFHLSRLLLALAFLTPLSAISHPALATLPQHIIWAWDRPEDLTWLPSDVGVAYLAAEIRLEGEIVRRRPRQHPLKIRNDTPLFAVVHVDASRRNPPVLHAGQRDAIIAELARVAPLGNRSVVQLDFEVRQSQRPFLAEVVTAARQQLPASTALSVTALASWCAGDFWLQAVPADEFVPMAFRMGLDRTIICALLTEHGRFPRSRCQLAVGWMAGEPIPQVTGYRQYYFSRQAWSAGLWQAISQRKSHAQDHLPFD